MPALFVLDTAEFAPLVRVAKEMGHDICHHRGYAVVSSPVQIAIERAKVKVSDAIWYGALTGGYEGAVAEFGPAWLRLVNAAGASSPQS